MGMRIKKNIPVATFYGLDLQWVDLLVLAVAILVPAPIFFTNWSLGFKIMGFLCLHAWAWPLILKMQSMPEGDMTRRINWLLRKGKLSHYSSVVPAARSLSESLRGVLEGLAQAGWTVTLKQDDSNQVAKSGGIPS
jgi:hypothetical protein